MDYTDEELADLAEMRTLRLRLRACAIAKVAECEAFEAAKTTLELNRQIRAIDGADRLVTVLYTLRRPTRRMAPPSAPPPVDPQTRSDTPSFKSVLDNANALLRTLKPDTPARDVRPSGHPPQAQRVETAMAPAAAALSPVHVQTAHQGVQDDVRDLDLAAIPPATQGVIDAVNQATCRFAEQIGLWPNGKPFVPGEDGWRDHALTQGLATARHDLDHDAWIRRETLLRANMIAAQSARKTGACLDGTPFDRSKPDYFVLSANAGTGVQRRTAHEIPGHDALPWWIVRAPP